MSYKLPLCLSVLLFMCGVVKSQGQVTCASLQCTQLETCVERSGVLGCECSENNTRPYHETYDALETCASSSGSLSLSRCQLFEAGYAADVLHLNDPNCKGELRGDKLVFMFDNDNNTCGTTLKTNDTHFIYENAVQSLGNGSTGVISRESWLSINFSCVYPLIQSISMPMVIEASHGVVSRDLSTEGSYTIRMLPFPNSTFVEPYSGSVTLDVGQVMYVAVEVEGVDSRQIALVMDNCWATPDNNSDSSLKWALVTAECPNTNDGTVHVLQNGVSASSQFSFKMFTFTGQSESIYLHCQVHLCLQNNGSCAHDCSGNSIPPTRYRTIEDTVAITMGLP